MVQFTGFSLRHFPQWLTPEDKESLLRHFGAEEVVVMPIKGRMVIFITYSMNHLL